MRGNITAHITSLTAHISHDTQSFFGMHYFGQKRTVKEQYVSHCPVKSNGAILIKEKSSIWEQLSPPEEGAAAQFPQNKVKRGTSSRDAAPQARRSNLTKHFFAMAEATQTCQGIIRRDALKPCPLFESLDLTSPLSPRSGTDKYWYHCT